MIISINQEGYASVLFDSTTASGETTMAVEKAPVVAKETPVAAEPLVNETKETADGGEIQPTEGEVVGEELQAAEGGVVDGEVIDGGAVEGEVIDGGAVEGEVVDGAVIDDKMLEEGMKTEEGFLGGGEYKEDMGFGDMSGEMGDKGASPKGSVMSSWGFVIGISAATLAVSIVLGILLAKKRIKKGFDLYED